MFCVHNSALEKTALAELRFKKFKSRHFILSFVPLFVRPEILYWLTIVVVKLIRSYTGDPARDVNRLKLYDLLGQSPWNMAMCLCV